MGDGSPGRTPTRTACAKPYYKGGSAISGEGEGKFLNSNFSRLSNVDDSLLIFMMVYFMIVNLFHTSCSAPGGAGGAGGRCWCYGGHDEMGLHMKNER
jgi:hypothetical protein